MKQLVMAAACILLVERVFGCPCQPQGAIIKVHPPDGASYSSDQVIVLGQEGKYSVTMGASGDWFSFRAAGYITTNQGQFFYNYNLGGCGTLDAIYTVFSTWQYEQSDGPLPLSLTSNHLLQYQKNCQLPWASLDSGTSNFTLVSSIIP